MESPLLFDDYEVPRHAPPPPPVPPKAPLKPPPVIPCKPAQLTIQTSPTLSRSLASDSARREFFGSSSLVGSAGGSTTTVTAMSPVRKTLTEISNSSSFAANATMDSLATNGNGRSFKALRSRSPSPTFTHAPRNGGNGHTTAANNGVREVHGFVGFANIPNQVFRKAVKKGFDLTMMVVGASGLGKSTFVNSLFLTEIYPAPHTVPNIKETTSVDKQVLSMRENNVTLNLTMVDTPGFGDQIDNTKCWSPIIDFVDAKYGEYFAEETKINRVETIADGRVHVCVYFIAPSGHGLKPLDVEFMRQLSERVNVIPVIAKADTLTREELISFKARILAEIKSNQIKIYAFPEGDSDETRELQSRVPFAVVGSNVTADIGGRKSRCRRYPWGLVEVENLEHNDFIALRNLLIRSHLVDLIDVTHSVHYENFRCRQLMRPGAKSPVGAGQSDPFTAMAAERKAHAAKLADREKDMERVFSQKVAEKEEKLRQLEQTSEAEAAAEERRLEALAAEVKAKRAAVAELRAHNPGLKPFESTSSIASANSESDGSTGRAGFGASRLARVQREAGHERRLRPQGRALLLREARALWRQEMKLKKPKVKGFFS